MDVREPEPDLRNQDMQIEFLKLNRKYRHDLAAFIVKKIADHAEELASDPVKNEEEINRIMDSILTPEEQGHIRALYELYGKEPADEEAQALMKRRQFHVVR